MWTLLHRDRVLEPPTGARNKLFFIRFKWGEGIGSVSGDEICFTIITNYKGDEI